MARPAPSHRAELPAALREGIDRALHRVPLAALRSAADALSRRYRGQSRHGQPRVTGDLAARAYAAARLPATYAAIRAALAEAAHARPDFSPRSMLDIGSGPGTAIWAARNCWPELRCAAAVEANPFMRKLGEELSTDPDIQIDWTAGDATRMPDTLPGAGLVTLAYVLNELPEAQDRHLIEKLWALAQDMLVIVEPGTSAGWRRLMAVRDLLIRADAHILAPCPHHARCPITAPDWCHFAQRLPRSRLHRLAKEGDVPWEDEKFSYLVASRTPARRFAARVVGPPRSGTGKVALKLCRSDGALEEKLITRREGEAFKRARRLAWGDPLLE